MTQGWDTWRKGPSDPGLGHLEEGAWWLRVGPSGGMSQSTLGGVPGEMGLQ